MFCGEGDSFIAFNTMLGYSGLEPYPVVHILSGQYHNISNYEWKWVPKGAQRAANRFFGSG